MAGFAKEVGDWSVAAQLKMDRAIRKVALDLFKSVILKSPVDTGRFRGNWQVAIGTVPQGTLEIDDKKGTVTVNKAEAVIAGLQADQTINLVNNLPYANRLEDGYSSQAPAGMVRLSVQEFSNILQRVGAEARRE